MSRRRTRKADVVVEREYRTQVQTHTCLETHGSVCHWEGDKLTVYASTQGTFAFRGSMQRSVGLPSRLRRSPSSPSTWAAASARNSSPDRWDVVLRPRGARNETRRPCRLPARPAGGASHRGQSPRLHPEVQVQRDEGRHAHGARPSSPTARPASGTARVSRTPRSTNSAPPTACSTTWSRTPVLRGRFGRRGTPRASSRWRAWSMSLPRRSRWIPSRCAGRTTRTRCAWRSTTWARR